jgi:CDP-glucose 4,6-dehydratase
MFLNAFKGSTVLVTGHTGFKGAWLSTWLMKLGARVVGYSLPPPTSPSVFEGCGLASRMEHIVGDVRDGGRLLGVMREAKPQFVFHLAAQPLVRESYAQPAATFEVNVMGTVSVLEALRALGTPCTAVMITTDKVYENREWEYGYREVDPLGGHDPYSASKAAMEMAVAAYRASFFPPGRSPVRLASVRAGNVIGGGDWSADRIVPDAIRSLAKGEALSVRNPAAVRPWQHVFDPLAGYLWLAASMAARPADAFLSSSWNFGPEPAGCRNVGELADAIVRAWGQGRWEAGDARGPHEAGLLRLSVEKARSRLQWMPVWGFEQAVAHTVEWYRRDREFGADTAARHKFSLEELERFERDAQAGQLAWASSAG